MTLDVLLSGLLGTILGTLIACGVTYLFQKKLLQQQLDFQKKLHEELLGFQKKSGAEDMYQRKKISEETLLKFSNLFHSLGDKAERIISEMRRK